MRTLLPLLMTLPFLFFISCGKNQSSNALALVKEKESDSLLTKSLVLPTTFGNDRIYYVSRSFDVPAGENLVNTFPSITQALADIASDMAYAATINAPFSYSDVSLKIQEGVYGAETNETYPIIFPSDLKVIGEGNVTINNVSYFNVDDFSDLNDPSMLTAIAILENTIHPIIKLGHNTILDAINISAGFGIGIMIEDDTHAILKNSTIHTSKTGLHIKDDAQLTILNSNISRNSLGIEVGDSANAIIQGSTISKNDIGIKSSNVSTLQFADKNRISDNYYCGLYDRGIGAHLLLSDQIEWDVPRIYDQCQNGVSIASNMDRNIIFQRVPDTITLFSDIPVITLTYPTHKDVISTTTPNIIWSPTPDNVVTKVAIFQTLPIVNAKQVINHEDIVWFWSSDAGDITKLGNLGYDDGESHGPLLKGKGYYYVVFEMNKSQTEITAASPVHFFTTNGDF